MISCLKIGLGFRPGAPAMASMKPGVEAGVRLVCSACSPPARVEQFDSNEMAALHHASPEFSAGQVSECFRGGAGNASSWFFHLIPIAAAPVIIVVILQMLV